MISKPVRYFVLFLTTATLSGCFPLTAIPIPTENKKMEIAYSFDRKEFVDGEILLSKQPKISLKVAGCKRFSCLPWHPLTFELIADPTVHLSPLETPVLVIGNTQMSVFVRDEISNHDRLRRIQLIPINVKVEELDGARLEIGVLKIEGQPVVQTTIWFSYREEVSRGVTYLPSSWK
jgi:hypothetical protein